MKNNKHEHNKNQHSNMNSKTDWNKKDAGQQDRTPLHKNGSSQESSIGKYVRQDDNTIDKEVKS